MLQNAWSVGPGLFWSNEGGAFFKFLLVELEHCAAVGCNQHILFQHCRAFTVGQAQKTEPSLLVKDLLPAQWDKETLFQYVKRYEQCYTEILNEYVVICGWRKSSLSLAARQCYIVAGFQFILCFQILSVASLLQPVAAGVSNPVHLQLLISFHLALYCYLTVIAWQLSPGVNVQGAVPCLFA